MSSSIMDQFVGREQRKTQWEQHLYVCLPIHLSVSYLIIYH